jgi:hypothetical protein
MSGRSKPQIWNSGDGEQTTVVVDRPTDFLAKALRPRFEVKAPIRIFSHTPGSQSSSPSLKKARCRTRINRVSIVEAYVESRRAADGRAKSAGALFSGCLRHRLSFVFRLLSRPLRNPEGKNVSAAYGFFRFLFSLFEQRKPKAFAAVFDPKGKTFRHQMYEAYKATRQKTPEDLIEQVPLVEEILKALKIPSPGGRERS